MARKLIVGSVVATLCAVALLGWAACSTDQRYVRAATPAEVEGADALAHRMLDGLGGLEAYRQLGGVSFDFIATFGGIEAVNRHHDWDKKNGMHRLVTGDGDDRTVVYTDLWDRHVVVERAGQVITGSSADEAAKKAWEAYINDTYWLIAPYKIFDEGVHRAVIDGDLRLSFDNGTGLTPGDTYIFAVDEKGALQSWSFLLESGVSASFDFKGRNVQQGVTFFDEKVAAVGTISFGTIKASAHLGQALFAPLWAHRSGG